MARRSNWFMQGQSVARTLVNQDYVFYTNLAYFNPTVYSMLTVSGSASNINDGQALSLNSIGSQLLSAAQAERAKEVNYLARAFNIDTSYVESLIATGGDDFYRFTIEALTRSRGLKTLANKIIGQMRDSPTDGMEDSEVPRGELGDTLALLEDCKRDIKAYAGGLMISQLETTIKALIAEDTNGVEERIQQAIHQIVTEGVQNTLKNTVEKYYQKQYENARRYAAQDQSYEKEVQVYQEILTGLTEMQNSNFTNPLLRGIYDNLKIDEVIKGIENSVSLSKKRVRRGDSWFKKTKGGRIQNVTSAIDKNMVTIVPTIRGTVNEFAIQAAGQAIVGMETSGNDVTITIKHTGDSKYKAKPDAVVIASYKTTIDADAIGNKLIEGLNSKATEYDKDDRGIIQNRIANRRRINEFINKTQDMGLDVNFDNQKTSKLQSMSNGKVIKFAGFSAGTAIPFRQLNTIMSSTSGKFDSDIGGRTFLRALLNTPNFAVGSGANQEYVKIALAKALSAMLFDDFNQIGAELSENGGSNYIHTLTLNNIVVPYSYFLQEMGQSLVNLGTPDARNIFNVKLTGIPRKALYPDGGTGPEFTKDGKPYHYWTFSDFRAQRNAVLDSIKVSATFMAAFESMILKLFPNGI